MTPEQIAHVCHAANRAVQIEQADPAIPVSEPWRKLDEETKQSAISGVLGVLAGNTPEQSHEAWCEFKFDHGWTLGWTIGPVKSEALKQHPLLVAYDLLPESQKVKDALFVAIVKALTDAE